MNYEIEMKANKQLKSELKRHIEELKLLPTTYDRLIAMAGLQDAICAIDQDIKRLENVQVTNS